MKKNPERWVLPRHALKKGLQMMKCSLILYFLGIIQVFALDTYSQQTKFSMNFESTRLESILNEIENQSEYYFLYNQDYVDVDQVVTVDVKDRRIEELLNSLLETTSIEFEIFNRQIVLTEKNDFLRQQQKTITGKVTDSNDLPLPGVTVVIKGSTVGTITDLDGEYQISEVPTNSTLVFSFVGLKTQEIQVEGRSAIDVTMVEDAIGLDEVVAIGYGTVRKRDLTGSVVSVGADKLEERPYSNAMQALSGQVSGVQITQTQGAPGIAPTVKVRGASSINAGTTPLYVVDGIPLEDNTSNSTSTGASSGSNMDFNRNPLNYINPNDIESIEILKDASSAAIYGSRGANGVVLITTKQGQAGETKIEANYEFGISRVNRKTEMMDAKQFIEFQTAARNNSWATIVANDPNATRGNNVTVPVEFSDSEWLNRIGNGTDWQDVLFRTAQSHNIQLSASGGNEKTQFMVSAGFLDSEGVVDQNTYSRINLRSNVRHKFNDRSRMGLNIGLSRAQEAPYGTSGKSDVTSLALQSNPIFPLYVETGSLGFKDPESIWNTFVKYGLQLWHPYSLTREADKKKIMNVVTASSYFEYDVLKDLTFKTSMSTNVENTFYNFYWNEGQNWGYSGWVPATADFITLQSYNWVWENTLNYNKTFNEVHDLSVLAGYSIQEQRTDYSNMRASSFPNDLVHTLNAGVVNNGSTSAQDWSLISYLARTNYSYKGKYLVTAAVRADGSSRFGSNNLWGYFPSGSVAWRMSEEAFLQSTSWLDNLKVRLSYGATGNNQIPNYGAIGILGYSPYVAGDNVEQGISTETFADKNLKWEKTGQVNFGVDMSILNQRVNFSGDIYYSKTRDLLLDVPIPILTGFSSTLTNVGELENKGFEVNVNTRNIDRKFKWMTDFNIFANRNKVLKLGENDAPIDINVSSMTSRTVVGKPIGMYYGYVIDGVIMSQAELNSNEYPVWPGSEPGDPRVKDVNDDGKIDSEDRTFLGNYQPTFQWGMTNTWSYEGIELSVMLRGSHGAEVLNHNARYLKSGVGGGNRNMYEVVSNFWRSESNPGNGEIPKPRMLPTTVRDFGSSYWVEDGSFVRIQNIRIGYNLPQRMAQKLNVGGVKLYVNMENVYVFSDYLGYDPEGSTYQTGVLVGFDYGAYPNPFTATAGVNITF
ncbi:SusC/RagA family TonB-linked outer membrane protein [Sunxiuqinia indica]|uniref:SusC/RagA family TonB-linked outer membrane protein n=1 Tax=Sunxiuqinia indica TaxID=2692584 RepID=UPI001356EC07|nr:TonB-dependent receptor [Sunxiuqinia indica]